MKTFRTLLDYELKKLIPPIGALLLLTATAAVAAHFTVKKYQIEDAGAVIWILVVVAATPFLAASTFANEHEVGAGNLWDFLHVTRDQRYIAKWSALVIAIPSFIILAFPAAMGLSAFAKISPDWSAGTFFALLAPPALVLGGACGGTLTRKTIAGGLIGGGICLLLWISNGKAWLDNNDALRYVFHYGWPYRTWLLAHLLQIFCAAFGLALPIGLLWSHYIYFCLHDETRSRWFAAGIFLPHFVILFAVFFGFFMQYHNFFVPFLLGACAVSPLILVRVVINLGGKKYLLRCAAWSYLSLAVIEILLGIFGDLFVGPSSKITAFSAILTGFLLAVLIFYRLLRRYTPIAGGSAFALAPAILLGPVGFLIFIADVSTHHAHLLRGGMLFAIALAITLFARSRNERTPIPAKPALHSVFIALLSVACIYAAVVVGQFSLALFAPAVTPSGRLVLVRSNDKDALRRAERLFALARDIRDPAYDKNPPDTAYLVPTVRADTMAPLTEETKNSLAIATPALNQFEEIISSGDIAFPYPPRIGPETPLPRFFSLISLSRLLQVKMQVQLAEGDRASSARTVALMIKGARVLRDGDGSIIQYLVALAMSDMANNASAEWFNATRAARTDPKAILAEAERAMGDDTAYRQAFASEYECRSTMLKDTYYTNHDNSHIDGLPVIPAIIMPLVFDSDKSKARIEEYFLRIIEAPDNVESLLAFRNDPTNFYGEILFQISAPRMHITSPRAKSQAKLTAIVAAAKVRLNMRRGQTPMKSWSSVSETEKINPLTDLPFETFGAGPDGIALEIPDRDNFMKPETFRIAW